MQGYASSTNGADMVDPASVLTDYYIIASTKLEYQIATGKGTGCLSNDKL